MVCFMLSSITSFVVMCPDHTLLTASSLTVCVCMCVCVSFCVCVCVCMCVRE